MRDVVRGCSLILDEGINGGVYNLCSGVERSIRSLLVEMINLVDLDVQIFQDSSRLRPAERKRACGNAALLNRDTGWMPEICMTQSLNDLLIYWENTIQ